VSLEIESAAALNFANQLRSAREAAIKDGEAFDVVIHAIERLGSFLLKCARGALGKYEKDLADLCGASTDDTITPFSRLFESVRDARNDALHQGAFARHLTFNAIELAVHLEDALRMKLTAIVKNYMVRNPTVAEPWQPISLIRQQMLANSFSFMPVKFEDRPWQLLSDINMALYLRINDEDERKKRMAKPLRDSADEITLDPAPFVCENESLGEAALKVAKGPALVHHESDPNIVVGILTAFDLL
jgi:hypothetical protein